MDTNIPYDTNIIEKIKNRFIKHHLTLAVAESVTSGHIQAALSTAKDASQFFQGGMTVYNIGQKCRHLLVEPVHALACDCVSDIVSETMAKNICQHFSSDVGMAITGYAAPVAEKGITSLYAWYAIAAQGRIILTKKIVPGPAEPFEVQVFFANAVLQALAGLRLNVLTARR